MPISPTGISRLIAGLLDRDFDRISLPVLTTIAESLNSGLIQRRLAELDEEAVRLAGAKTPRRLRPDNPVFRALVADMKVALAGAGARVGAAADDLQGAAGAAAGATQRELAEQALRSPAAVASLRAAWNTPDPEAVHRLVNYSTSSAWEAEVNRFAPGLAKTIRNQSVQGIVQGWGPLRTAARIREIAENLPVHRARTMMRTLQLTSYRDATAAHQTANLHIAQKIIRWASLDQRTCLSCIAAHGDVLWERGVNSESEQVRRVNDHHNGRCTSFIITGRYTQFELGPRSSGKKWFNSLSPEYQQRMATFRGSPGKLAALRNGEVQLDDFRKPYKDKVFGEMLRESSLRDARAKRALISSPDPSVWRTRPQKGRSWQDVKRNPPERLKWHETHGGRVEAGFTPPNVGDCFTRASKFITGKPYAQVFAENQRLNPGHDIEHGWDFGKRNRNAKKWAELNNMRHLTPRDLVGQGFHSEDILTEAGLEKLNSPAVIRAEGRRRGYSRVRIEEEIEYQKERLKRRKEYRKANPLKVTKENLHAVYGDISVTYSDRRVREADSRRRPSHQIAIIDGTVYDSWDTSNSEIEVLYAMFVPNNTVPNPRSEEYE